MPFSCSMIRRSCVRPVSTTRTFAPAGTKIPSSRVELART
jgi:hypothetical protein